jgi:hypothetical protein
MVSSSEFSIYHNDIAFARVFIAKGRQPPDFSQRRIRPATLTGGSPCFVATRFLTEIPRAAPPTKFIVYIILISLYNKDSP